MEVSPFRIVQDPKKDAIELPGSKPEEERTQSAELSSVLKTDGLGLIEMAID